MPCYLVLRAICFSSDAAGLNLENHLVNDELDSELIIGLVCAVGTESNLVIDLLQECLELAGYQVHRIKVSQDIIPELVAIPDHKSNSFERYWNLMDAGNNCRKLGAVEGKSNNAVLALGIARHIAGLRQTLGRETNLAANGSDDCASHDPPRPLPRTAFIIDSLKRPEEVETLRVIYPSGFISLGIHADEARRQTHLVRNKGMSSGDAERLLVRDAEEAKDEHGQRVNDTFHLADFFVRITDNRERLRCDLRRMVELWFGNPFITPTFEEHAMFLAFAAALRSADLSRQVGAVITRDSQVLATGANECPQAGGGLYWPSRNGERGCIDDLPDGRDYKRSEGDSNRAEQARIIEQIITEAKKEDENFNGELLRQVLTRSGIRDLTEFGRVVHAEMEALLSCARNSISTHGATMFCTTFPCHNCAKHIVAAGLKRVIYVEPYPKSKALTLHDDSIVSQDESSADDHKKMVVFQPFVGVGPRRFFDLFSMNLGSSYKTIRKISGDSRPKKWSIENAQLRLQMKPASYLELEAIALSAFREIKAFAAQPRPGDPL